MIQVPVSQNGNSDVDITLEGITYTLQYRFNTRNNRFFLNILRENVELIMGMRLIEFGTPNFSYPFEDVPPGTFLVAQFQKDLEDFATIGNLGINEDYSLLYINSDELEEI